MFLLLITGSLWELLSEAINNPVSTAENLGRTIPSQGIYFINYIILNAIGGFPGTSHAVYGSIHVLSCTIGIFLQAFYSVFQKY